MSKRLRFLSGLIAVVMSAGCGIEKDGDDSDLTRLTSEEKVAALAVFLPWANLRGALDQMATTSADVSVNEDARAIATELEKLCVVRRAPDRLSTFMAEEDQTTRVNTLAIGPSVSRPDCPIRFHERAVVERRTIHNTQQTMMTVTADYSALAQDAMELLPVAAFKYEGTIESRSGQIQSDLVHAAFETYSGRLTLEGEEPINVRWQRKTKTKFRGTSSVTEETVTRSARVGRRAIEWLQERELTDLKLATERNFLNHEEISAGDYEKLRGEALAKSRRR